MALTNTATGMTITGSLVGIGGALVAAWDPTAWGAWVCIAMGGLFTTAGLLGRRRNRAT